MGVKSNGTPSEPEDNSQEDDLTAVITSAMGTLETKLTEYLTTNVAPLIDRIKQLETTVSQSGKLPENSEPTTVEQRLAQLEREKLEAEETRKRNESDSRLKGAIDEALGKAGALEEVDFLKSVLYNDLKNSAEDTQSGWLVKGSGKTAQEYVTDFLQKPTGKRFIKVETVPGSGTPEPKTQPKSATPTDISSVLLNTIW